MVIPIPVFLVTLSVWLPNRRMYVADGKLDCVESFEANRPHMRRMSTVEKKFLFILLDNNVLANIIGQCLVEVLLEA